MSECIEVDFPSVCCCLLQVPITTPIVVTLWKELLGSTVKAPALIMSRVRLSSNPNVTSEVNTEWSYQELEAVLVDGFVQKGLLHKHDSGYVVILLLVILAGRFILLHFAQWLDLFLLLNVID